MQHITIQIKRCRKIYFPSPPVAEDCDRKDESKKWARRLDRVLHFSLLGVRIRDTFLCRVL